MATGKQMTKRELQVWREIARERCPECRRWRKELAEKRLAEEGETVTMKEILEAAKAQIDTPEKWLCDGSMHNGERACAMGAIENVTGEDAILSTAYNALRSLVGAAGVGDFNDTHSHAEVMALFDRAIAKAS